MLYALVESTFKLKHWKRAVFFYCTRRIYFLLLPILFRAAYQTFSGSYITNALHINSGSMRSGLQAFFATLLLQAENVFATAGGGGRRGLTPCCCGSKL